MKRKHDSRQWADEQSEAIEATIAIVALVVLLGVITVYLSIFR